MYMNKPVYLGLSILELSKIVMYESQYDYVKPKYGEKVKLCYMDTEKQIIFIKTLHKMLKQGFIYQLMNQSDDFQKEKIRCNLINER